VSLPVAVRGAAPADIPAMVAVAERSYRSAFAAILEPGVLAARDAPFFAERFQSSWPRMRVAERAGAVLGFSLVTDAHLDMLFVNPAEAGTGAGGALLRFVEREGCTSLECFRDNHAARSFYERQGWTLTRGYERDFLGHSRAFVRYEKPLTPDSAARAQSSPTSQAAR
jgi:putative acetyltransferase